MFHQHWFHNCTFAPMNFRLFIGFIFISLIFVSCDEYQKVLKSPNPELKYAKSIEYYEAGEYQKAMSLFEEIMSLYKGTDKGQKIYYYYAYTNFRLGLLLSAAYYFRNYYSTYPNSENAEDALFMSAYCNYLDSPKPTLDQTPTYLALEELQIFVNTFPESELVDSANVLVDELNLKLETKAYYNAKLYYKIRKYKSAIVALNEVLANYPSSTYEKEIKLLVIKAYYYLAINSIEEKKLERFNLGIEAYTDFIDNFADSDKAEEAELFYAKLVREKEKLLLENPSYYEL